jgi:hypothetical protein
MIRDELKKDWCDSQLQGLWWENSGRDLVLSALLPSGERFRRVKFSWARELIIQLDFGKVVAGMPLAWRADFEDLPNSEVSVLIDFGSTGEMRFICSEVCEPEDP